MNKLMPFLQKYAILIPSLLLILAACTKEVKIDIPGFKENLVIDGSIEVGQPAIVLLSKSANIYAPTNLEAYINSFVDDATVIISNGTTIDTLTKLCTDNLPPGTEEIAAAFFGIPVEQLAEVHICAFVSTEMVGEVGKTYDLKVIRGEKTYTASTSILPPTALDSLYWKPQNGLTDLGFSWAKLNDPGANSDAYRWEVKYVSDAGFSKPFNPYFNDKFFNGLSFEFAYENPMSFNGEAPENEQGYFKRGDTIVVKLSKLGQREFNFFDKKYTQMYTAGNPFATPTNIPSNIQGGAFGIWVGYSYWMDTLICQ